jgi:hypothetical protein
VVIRVDINGATDPESSASGLIADARAQPTMEKTIKNN